MSKKVTKKKAPDAPPVPAAPAPAAVAVPTDARVAQQLRVLETVGSASGEAKETQKYSPRTEAHIQNLSDVLDCLGFSRGDIAGLVRKCNHDEQQIQIAVANIIEDKMNRATPDWGTVKNKKQQKEEKRLKEEEEKREQELAQREMEKERREAEKRAQKEYARAAYQARSPAGQQPGTQSKGDHYDSSEQWHQGNQESVTGTTTSLPPDPAILFAGPQPVEHGGDDGKKNDDWWKGGNSSWAEWDGKCDDKARTKGGHQDWNWQHKQWDKSNWDGGGGRRDDGGWGGDWDKNAGASDVPPAAPAAAAPGKKKTSKEKSAPLKKELEIWDMPDTTAVTAPEGGLDQWALGDIRAHERRVTGDSGDALAQDLGALTATVAAPAHSPATALPASAAAGSGGAERHERGKGKGKGTKGERRKGGDRGDRGTDRDRGSDRAEDRGAERSKSAAEREDRADKERLDRLDRSDDPRKQAVEEVGENVTVRKHSSMGCAVVTFRDTRVREAIISASDETNINGIRVQMKRHTDKDTKAEVMTDIFVAWGRQVEKTTPLSERVLVKHFDQKHIELVESWREMEEKSRQAEEQKRQHKMLEDLRRQEEEQQQQLAEMQRKRLEETQMAQRETQAKWMHDLQGNWAHMGMAGVGAGAVDPRFGATALSSANAAATAAAARASAAAAAAVAGTAGGQSHSDPMAAAASARGLNPGVAAYPQAAAAQWSVAQQAQAQQWMQAMQQAQAYQTQQQSWQSMAAQQQQQRGMQQQMHSGVAGMPSEDYNNQLRAHAAYYAYMTDQQRGSAAGYTPQAGYLPSNQPPSPAFGYSAAGYGNGRGERI
mmetsp:Transcript_2111/g.4817  ORF Transcript_2111/g.4817 Transcript_2111/m.4817 type:complete len:829 (+) Transcript_2111:84-2570(+)